MITDLSDDMELLKHNTCFFLVFKLCKQSEFEVGARHKNAENIS